MQKANESNGYQQDVNGNTCDHILDTQTSSSCRDHSPSLNDWHLLDVNTAKEESKPRGDKDNSTQSYVETDPLEGEQFSPALVYLCTAIYSLVPLAAAVCGLLLIFLLFTRFYFVTLAYWLFVLLDKKSYNTGK